MPPVYALLSSLSIWLHDHKSYLLFIRDIYESFVIYNFFQLLKAYIGFNEKEKRVEDTKVYQQLAQKGEVHHSFPVSLWAKPLKLKTPEDGKALFLQCEKGILQYIPIKIACAAIDIFDLWAYVWLPGSNIIYYLCSAVVSTSVSIALYYLVLFFHMLMEELASQKPMLKFLTIKGVLFLTFWQEVALWFFSVPLSHARFIPKADREEASETLSSVMVSIEMVLMALLTTYAYSHRDFVTRKDPKKIN